MGQSIFREPFGAIPSSDGHSTFLKQGSKLLTLPLLNGALITQFIGFFMPVSTRFLGLERRTRLLNPTQLKDCASLHFSEMFSVTPYPGHDFGAKIIRGIRYARGKGRRSEQIPEKKTEQTFPKFSIQTGGNESILPFLKENIFSGANEFPELAIYIHGSWADNTRTAFSDLDDLVFVEEADIPSQARANQIEHWLNQVDQRILELDPLQHHGHWILPRRSLEAYNNSVIPFNVLANSLCLQGREQLIAQVDTETSLAGIKANIHATKDHARQLFAEYQREKIGIYKMKQLVGCILILPAYIRQSRGEAVSKRQAIEEASKHFPSDALRVILAASEIRLQWHRIFTPQVRAFYKILSASVKNPHLFRELNRRISPRFENRNFPRIAYYDFDEFLKACSQ